MGEDDQRRANLDRARSVMGKTDPILLSAALSEMTAEADELEDADVAKAKEAIKKVYDSIPEGKNKNSILSKAIAELDSDIAKTEIKTIKENLADIDRGAVMEVAEEYIDPREISLIHSCYHMLGGDLEICKREDLTVTIACARCINLISVAECRIRLGCGGSCKLHISSPLWWWKEIEGEKPLRAIERMVKKAAEEKK